MEDKLPEWMTNNLIPHLHMRFLLSKGYLGGGKLMGNNGVYCELVSLVHEKSSGESPPTPINDAYSNPYRRIIKISSSPVSKPLPQNLSNILKEHNYEELGEASEHIAYFRERLTFLI